MLKSLILKNIKLNLFINENEIKLISEKITNFGVIFNRLNSNFKGRRFKKINIWLGGNYFFILRFNAKIDGCNTKVFHEKCDNIRGCIIVCKVLDGDIILGYISTKIINKNEFSDDSKSFVFNLSKNIFKKTKQLIKMQ